MNRRFSPDAYAAYLKSPEWASKRSQRLEHDGWRCTGCGEDGTDARLEVHHLTYERVGAERIEDLLTLCNLCHAREHGRSPLAAPIAGPTRKEVEERRKLLERQERAASGSDLPLWDRVAQLKYRADNGDQAAVRALNVIRGRLNIAEKCRLDPAA